MSMGGHSSNSKKEKRLMGLDLQGAEYGNCVPVVFGKNKFSGNVMWYGDFQAIPHKQKQGGKGGGGQSSTSYTYKSSFMVGLCEGPATIKNVYNGTTKNTLASFGGIAFTGTLTQAVWSHLTGIYALNYSATAHADFQNFDLGDSASLPNLSFEMLGRNPYNAGTIDDANPADIVTAICTDTQIGIQFNQLGDMTQFSNYCRAAGIFFSPVYDQQQPASSVLEDLFKYANTAPWYSEGLLKAKPYADVVLTGNGVTYTPDSTIQANLGAADFITNGNESPIKGKRVAPADCQNIVRLEYKDRSADYRTIPVQATIDQDMINTGVRALDSESVDMITSAAVARLVAQNLVQRAFYIRNTYEFQLSWRWCWLEPMDIVTLTDTATGLNLSTVRIIEIGEDDEGLLSVICEEMPDGVGHGGTYGTETLGGATVDVNVDPGPITAPYLFRGPGFIVPPTAPQIWCAIAAQNAYWGGADVYISNDGITYNYLTTHCQEARYGYSNSTVAVQADLDTVSTINVTLNGNTTLSPGTTTDRDEFVTMAMVDNELFSYMNAALVAGPSYNLSSLRRGGYGTSITTHAVNAPFVRLDDTILKIPVDPSQVGKTVWLKFLSFNCFGRFGPRTLSSETAYSYVIGTNVEFPDVPVAPTNFTITSVADGVNLRWTNPNPAAVASTSIEFATAVGGPYTVLGQTGATTTFYHHAFTAGSTFFYRIRSRGHQVSAGWSAYTTPGSGTGYNTQAAVLAAQTDATSALNQLVDISNDNLLTPGEKPQVIKDRDAIVAEQAGIDTQANQFGIITEKATYDTAVTALTAYLATLTAPVLWSTLTGNTTIVGTTFRQKFLDVYAARQALLNAIYQEAQYIADGKIGAVGDNLIPNPSFIINNIGALGGVTSNAGEQIVDGWFVRLVSNGALNWGATTASIITQVLNPTLANGVSAFADAISLPIPVNASTVYNMSFGCTQAFNGTVTGGVTYQSRMVVDWQDATGAHISYSILAQARGAANPGELKVTSPSTAVRCQIWVDTIVTNSSGASWTHNNTIALRSTFTWVQFVRQSDLERAGSGHQIGDTRNLLQLNVGNGTAKVPTVVSFTSAAGTPATATISVAAFTILSGSVSVSYGSKSVGVTGTNGTAVTYYLYLDDPTFSGTGTLVATTNGNTVWQGDGRVYIGTVSFTYPTSGSGSGSGSGGGGPNSCVCIDMSLDEETLALEARVGKLIDCLDLPVSDQKFRRRIQAVRFSESECVRLITDEGAELDLAACTPFDLLDGRSVRADEMLNEFVVTDLGIETVVTVLPLGLQPVARISAGGVSYAAGRNPKHRIFSHNVLKP